MFAKSRLKETNLRDSRRDRDFCKMNFRDLRRDRDFWKMIFRDRDETETRNLDREIREIETETRIFFKALKNQ